MRPRIHKPTINSTLRAVLNTVHNAREREMFATLLLRYGAKRVTDLLPEQVAPFTTELQAVLHGKAPHPADSTLDPTTMEVSK